MLLRVTEYGHILYQLDVLLHRFNCQDQYQKTMYTLKPFVVYLNGLESIGQILMLQEYLELRLICLTWHMFLYLWTMI